MKRAIIIAATLLLTVGILINCRTQKRNFSELIQTNVEALADDEWGGGHTMPWGEVIWYEYQRTSYEFHYCGYPYYLDPLRICDCTIKTCHGYGDLFCIGSIVCL